MNSAILKASGLLLLILSGAVPAETLVGELPGDVNVDNTGAASYTIPVSIPSGTAGMQPSLSIKYSSQGGIGILGMGFSLDGLSAVSRAPATRLHDGIVDGVDFDGLDRLVMDGQRLMVIPTNAVYGADGTQYRTEIDSFARITLHGAMNSTGSWFEVRTKSGLIYEYGRTANSFVEPEGRTNALSWAVSKISDTVGNYMLFGYSENAGEPHLLTNIVYTGNDARGLSPYNEVAFIYENRSDTRTGYMAGSKYYGTKRLQKIIVKGNAETVSEYQFNFATNYLGISTLQSVQQVFGNDALPKTVFEYSEKNQSGLFAYLNGTQVIPDGSAGNVYRSGYTAITIGDFNGDGLTDVASVYPNNQSQYSWIALAGESGGFVYTNGTAFIPDGSIGNVYRGTSIKILSGDVNGDGLTDMISIHPNSSAQYSWIGLSDGDGTFTHVSGTNFIPDGALNNVYRSAAMAVKTGDFNGDGLTDVVSIYPSSSSPYSWIGLSKGDGTFNYISGTNFIPNGALNSVFRNENSQPPQIADFNGDGLADIAAVFPNSLSQYSWIGLSKGDGTFNYISGTNFIPNGVVNNVFRNENSQPPQIADFNGDGLADIAAVFPNNSAQYSWMGLSKGDGTFQYISGTNFIPNGSLGNVYRDTSFRPFAADVNGDGLADLVSIYPNNDSDYSWVGLSNGDGTFTYISGEDFIPDGADNSLYRAGSLSVQPGDFDGDGLLDILSVYPDNTASHSWLACNLGKHTFLSKVTKGYRSAAEHGAVTELQYLPITDSSIYEKGTGAQYPVYDIQAPMYVVSTLSKDNGAGGKYDSNYIYADARLHRDRGFLGFRIFESYDCQTHLGQVEILEQAFPWIGSQISSETYYSPDPINNPTNIQHLKEVRNTWLYDTVQNGTIFSYVAKSVEKKWELGETDTNNTISEVISYNWFDDQDRASDTPNLIQPTNGTPQNIIYGNITKIVMDYGNGSKQISSNQYLAVNTNVWLLGRLSSASVTHVLDGKPSVTRTSSFDYDATTGLLLEEQVEPEHPTLELTTGYQYDGFGNITNKIVSAPGIAARAVQQSDYAAGGRFVNTSRNILGHSETYQYDQKTGLVTAKTGPNGLTTSMQYDPLGRTEHEIRADGTEVTTEYVWDSSVVVSAQDPANPQNTFSQTSSYRITKQSSGSAPVTVWYDSQGREIREMTLSPGGNKKICQDTVYNGLGQAVAVSENYFLGETYQWGFSEYDALGRKQYVTVPDGTVTEYVYNGLTTQVIVDSDHRSGSGDDTPKNQVTTTIQNAQGQTLRVIDNLGNALTYEYDAVGNLIKTTDAASNTVQMVYDIRGNKIQQIDPDMGTWHYTCNALGELISQTDAAGNRVENAYDTLGRIVARTNRLMTVTNGLQLESTSAWYYDGTDAGCWLGTLRREELRDGQGNLTYRKTYAYDSYGRPMLELYNFDNKWYYTCYRYDQFSRLKFTDRFWRSKAVAESGDNLSPLWNVFSTVNTFNQYGVVTKVSDSAGHIWWKIDDRDVDSKGHLLKYTLGNGTVTSKTYDQDAGFLTAITCRNASSETADIQNDLYSIDRLGNLKSRQNLRQILLRETFTYDGLNRLTQSTVESSLTNSASCDVSYNAIGNILSKTGAGIYTYGQSAGPHAVTAVTDYASRITSYSYDANGNMLGRSADGTNTLTTLWTSFNKPLTMFSGLNGSTFTYDINNSRITQIIETDTGLTKTVKKKIYIAGMEQDEEVTNPNDGRGSWQWNHKETRIYINTPSGTVGIHVQDGNENISRKYFHTDHLGSIVAVTGAKIGDSAPLLAEYSFDAWGKRRNAADWSPIANPQSSIGNVAADRGFTGHEMLDHLGLVHMNGRIYDANLGRFLSADPTIQFPGDMQDYNRYSYVGNNPLKYTDPSGYSWWSKHVTKNFSKYWKTAVVIIIAVLVTWFTAGLAAGLLFPGVATLSIGQGIVVGAIAGAAGGFAGGVTGSLLNGGSFSDALKAGLTGALWGGISGAIAGGIGSWAEQFKDWKYVEQARWCAHGMRGGLVAFGQGGSVEAGFLAGFFGAAVGEHDIFSAAIVGGCASEIGGGKFESGAITAAFGYQLNHCLHAPNKVANQNEVDRITIDDEAVTPETSKYIIEQDKYITDNEAIFHYKHGGEVPLSMDASKLTVMQYARNLKYLFLSGRTITAGYNDYAVHGQVELNGSMIRSGSYDYRMHPWNLQNTPRNIATWMRSKMIGAGTEYDIFYENQPTIIHKN